jgi:hypothetical protein
MRTLKKKGGEVNGDEGRYGYDERWQNDDDEKR